MWGNTVAKKIMWGNIVTIHKVLKKKTTKQNQQRLFWRKKRRKIFIKKKKKNNVGKHYSNP
jgi:hypothetical protein